MDPQPSRLSGADYARTHPAGIPCPCGGWHAWSSGAGIPTRPGQPSRYVCWDCANLHLLAIDSPRYTASKAAADRRAEEIKAGVNVSGALAAYRLAKLARDGLPPPAPPASPAPPGVRAMPVSSRMARPAPVIAADLFGNPE